jgi:energy-coupling factor transporter ATP-binding protein EcfA2
MEKETKTHSSKQKEKDMSAMQSDNSHLDNSLFELSDSVLKAKEMLSDSTSISAAAFAKVLFEIHGEYAGSRSSLLKLEETERKRSFQEWIEEVQKLFDASRIQEYSNETAPPVMHGRMTIVGLCLLDNNLRSQLERDNVFSILVGEIKEPLKDILTKSGGVLYYQASESVPNQSDEPLKQIDEDMLGRAAFARFLAKRISTTDDSEGAYSIHLCGPWGAGKTTVLNFLEAVLEKNSTDKPDTESEKETIGKIEQKKDNNRTKWIVVKFNAWQNQHINQPWWTLYARIFRKAKGDLSLSYKLKEYSWRLLAGQPFYLMVLVLVFWLIVLIFNLSGTDLNSSEFAKKAKELSEILAFVTTVAGIAVGSTRSLIFSSAKAAESFQEYASDPMRTIQKRFGKLLAKLNKRARLIIFVDDLDRCNSQYVVRLLEGIQTLFRQGSVFFIVASDKKWLCTCFEEEYKEFKDSVKEPGKSLGTLFTEKTFQLCASIPSVHKDFKTAYWNGLIKVEGLEIKKEIDKARQDALLTIGESSSDGELNDVVKHSTGKPIYEQLALREEAVVHLATPEAVARTEHTLRPFLPLLDNNPRAMKRLVNAYSVNRTTAILSFLDIDLEDLVQWTIISMRWPQLADYLSKNPDKVGMVGQDNLANVEEEIRYLFKDREVVALVAGGMVTNRLTKATVEECAQLG